MCLQEKAPRKCLLLSTYLEDVENETYKLKYFLTAYFWLAIMSDLGISQQTFVQNNLTIATPALTKPLNSNEVEKLVRLSILP